MLLGRYLKGYKSISYKDFEADVLALSSWLKVNGLSSNHIAVVGENSYHWVVVYMATVVSGGTIVPVDKELSTVEMANVITQSEAKALFCSEDYLEVADELKQTFDIPFYAINCDQCDQYTPLSDLLVQGTSLYVKDPSLARGEKWPQDVASIVFTSGTTGFSKGVMLTRENLISNVLSSDEFIQLGDCVLSVLPMSHTYEFTLDILFSIYQGRTIAINNSIKNFAQNIKLFAPTDMLLVPLVAVGIYNNIWNGIRAQGKEKLVRTMIVVSNTLRILGIDLRRKLFKSILDALGGRLNALFVGGAPVEPSLVKGFGDFGIQVNIGYGITECSPLVNGNITGKPKYSDTCGVSMPHVEIRINQPNEKGEGEIEVRGKSVMVGYYKNEAATKKAFHDGWFRTGDIGRVDKRGNLHITGRLKNLIVLKNGKNVYPEELESIIEKITPVKEVVVGASGNGA
ncbi:MAG: AMP-binding protein, partial [Mucinivorans sp.]